MSITIIINNSDSRPGQQLHFLSSLKNVAEIEGQKNGKSSVRMVSKVTRAVE